MANCVDDIEALMAVVRSQKAGQEYDAALSKLEGLWEAFYLEYAADRRLMRQLCQGDCELQPALGLDQLRWLGPDRHWFEQARIFYSRIQRDPILLRRLAEFGYGPERFNEMVEMISRLSEAFAYQAVCV